MRMVGWMNFKEELDQKTVKLEAMLQGYLPAEEGYRAKVASAMNYSVMAGGKRLRPLMMAESAVAEAGDQEQRMLIAQREINVFLNQ